MLGRLLKYVNLKTEACTHNIVTELILYSLKSNVCCITDSGYVVIRRGQYYR